MEKLRCKITFCDPATRRVEGIIKGNAIIQIAVWEIPIAFRWPQPNEMWTIHYSNGFWHLGQKVDYDEQLDVTTKVEDLDPGDTRVSTAGKIVLDGDVHVYGSLIQDGAEVGGPMKWQEDWDQDTDYVKNDVVSISDGSVKNYFVAKQSNLNSDPSEDEGEYWSHILSVTSSGGGGTGGGNVYWIGSGSGYDYSSLGGITSPSKGDIAIDTTNKKNYAYNGTTWREFVKPALSTSDVTDLDTQLAGKASTSHTHAYGGASLTGFGTAAAKNVPAVGVNASTTEVVMGDDGRLSNARDPNPHSHSTSETWLSNALATKADSSALATKADSSTVTAALATKADLVSGTVPLSQLPTLPITNVFTVTNASDLTSQTTAQQGDVGVVTSQSKTYILASNATNAYATLSNWKEILTPTTAVTSVNGSSGAITLDNTWIQNWDTALAAKGYAVLAAASNSFTGNVTLGSVVTNTHTINGVTTFVNPNFRLGSTTGVDVASYSFSPTTFESNFGTFVTGSLYLRSGTTTTPVWVKRNGTWIDVAYTDDSRFPSSTEKSALAGTSGTPGSSNAYVTNNDSRMSDARANATWMTVSEKSGLITQNNDVKFVLGMGTAVISSLYTTGSGFGIYIDPADYSVSGRTTQFRLRVIVQVNNVTTVKASIFTVGLMSMANDDFWANFWSDTGNQAKTYPAVTTSFGATGTGLVTSSNCSPGSDISPQTSGSLPGNGTFVSSTFSISSANRYAIYVYTPNTAPTGMTLATGTGNALAAEVMAFLQVRYT